MKELLGTEHFNFVYAYNGDTAFLSEFIIPLLYDRGLICPAFFQSCPYQKDEI
jgi:hypothetical protein